ncbi:phytanoyl-CoA dioxygenase family protein [Rhodobacteraceae bacterium RKSG542]|uniref:phytanoyl-CoA dioxygenase family protein n=1 Tax=Pseudovibrio flavus TaxID=2529854 RepID=UPI0012BBA5A9|nr:phytanoyl-CoA dioxygenase family protein [Pseudovibrio flavus]MTI17206.1 phytanoyl-CoA dioxygenase family protein [Pseudovibrio flavus]
MKARSFKATSDGSLTPEMLEAYKEDGFLVLEDYVTAQECDGLQNRMRDLIDAFDPASVSSVFETGAQTHARDAYFRESGDKIRFFFEAEAFGEGGKLTKDKQVALNKVGHGLHDLDPVFRQFSRNSKMERTAKDLGLVEPLLAQSMYILKPPHIGGEVNCHQDSTFLHTQPLSCTGFWFALEDADATNGGLYGEPGGHKEPLRQRFHYDGDKLVMETLDETPMGGDEKHAPLVAPKGTLVILHGQVPHKSAPNRSDRSRHAYAVHMVDGKAKWSKDNWLVRSEDNPMQGF